ncbi:MAG TPA: pyruvate, phosphate dikinase [Treponemataceae bacterium]|nr:pyruvate, phosphate dikinase [Treponemataceae bacterium]
MSDKKFVYFFGGGKAEGDASMKNALGGKGANLAEMTNLRIPVPPGFTISTEVCKLFYENNETYPKTLRGEVAKNLEKLEKTTGKKIGDEKDPLLVSIRSGAAVSMPGMMDTVLNLGLNDKSVKGIADKSGNPRFAWDAYRRFIQMYGDVAMGVPHAQFEKALEDIKIDKGVKLDTDLDAQDLEKLVNMYKKIYEKYTGTDFPQDPIVQLWGAIDAVFGSWMNARAIKYRAMNAIRGLEGTAVNIQSMVFGNFGETSGTGVCFSRDPSTGEHIFYGEYLLNAQGEDVVAGTRTPLPISALKNDNAEVYEELCAIRDRLERHYRDMQDMEFTVQQGELFILQTRSGKRTGQAAVRCAVEMEKEGLIDKKTAVMRVSPDQLDQLLHPQINEKSVEGAEVLTEGLNASPGAACGQIVFTADEADSWVKNGHRVILVRKDTSPEDITGMGVAEGILTSTGGMTSHAAVVARGMGKPCVCGAHEVFFDGESVFIGESKFKRGDYITVDGSTGKIYRGQLELAEPNMSENVLTFLSWCDDIRNHSVRKMCDGSSLRGFSVRANADQPIDAQHAFDFGAEGIGLCRTEHMFFDRSKLLDFRAMIASTSEEKRKEYLNNILPLQEKDFIGILEAIGGRPVTIRLLDPPLHEFIPHTLTETEELAEYMKTDISKLQVKLDALHEVNPMLGHRGCRLAITFPEIYDMQVEAIARAAAHCIKKGIAVDPEIMIPIVCDDDELDIIRKRSVKIIANVFEKNGITRTLKIGSMIEVPRGALLADKLAKHADFFSFGTNDLTQMTFAFSRDDSTKFLTDYLVKDVLMTDPFKVLDEEGVGQLMTIAKEKSRSVKPDMKLGICGEHGGDPDSIDFCYRVGLNYVSCSPYRVPIARLAAAQAVLRN